VASDSLRLPENAAGPFFVDETCIDCDTCRQLAPDTFSRSDARGMSFVAQQPGDPADRRRASLALVACPSGSIGTADKSDVAAATRAFPLPVDGQVAYCGYASADSYGASSYFLRRGAGNVLVDSPRAARSLLDNLAGAGGVALMFLSHRDDVADHAIFAHRFGCRRILHAADVGPATRGVEMAWEGRDAVELAPDLTLIPLPGHTRGSAALLFQRRYLFTGDHLWGSETHAGRLEASRSVCWYSWPEQIHSMERLLELEFEWVLPGHGRRYHAGSPAAMRRELERLIDRMKCSETP
jgi:glyoxylase-like metal-dependent hydrolase (beta-lactamase superfamily II)/ferredoxin